MSRPTRDRQQNISEVELENQRLRQEIDGLRRQLEGQVDLSRPPQISLSERFLRLAIDTIPQSVFWKDRNSVYLGCDQSFAQLGGLNSPEEVIGKTDYDLPWKPEEAEFFLECDRRVMESGVAELGIIEPQLQSDGSQHWLETNKVPLRDHDGTVIGILGTFVDVTQLQQTQLELQQQNDTLAAEFEARTQKLQATESRLKRLADNLPGVIFQFRLESDGTQSFPYASDKSREVYEIEPDNFIQVFDFVHPEDLGRLQDTIQESAQTLQRFDCEYRITTPSGVLKWLQAMSQPIQQEDGDIIWDGIIIDISDRKAAEEELRQKEAQYRQVFETISDGLGIVDLELGQLVECNPAYHQMHGYSYGEFLALPYVDIVHPDSHALLGQFITDVQEGRVFTCQAQNIHSDGHLIDIEVKGVPFPYHDKTHALVLVRDTSDRKAAEGELRQKEAQYRQVFESIIDGLGIIDLELGQLVECNPAYHQMHGYSYEEFLNLPFTKIIHPDLLSLLGEFIADIKAGRIFNGQGQNLHSSGRVIDVDVKGVPFPYRGKTHALVLVRDISDRKSAEEKLRQKETQYRQVFESILDGLGIIDLEQGKLVESNPAYHQMHGYSYSEFLALPFVDVVHPDSYALLGQFITDVKEGRVFTCQAQNLHSSGRIVDVDVKGIPFPYRDKTHALVLVRDISEKVRWERDHALQVQALQSIVEGTAAHTGDEFFRACVKSLATALDVAYVLIAEVDSSQAEGNIANVLAFWMGTDFGENFQYDLCSTPCNNVFGERTICRYTDSVQALFPDDAYLIDLGAESYVGIPLVDSHGMTVGLIAVLHTEPMPEASEQQTSILEIFAARVGAEIERMRSDKALREKDRILQLTLQAGKLGCWSWNRFTNEVIWSDGVEDILGLEANSFGGTLEDYLALVYPEDLDMVQQSITQTLETEQEYRIEHRLVPPDGSVQWIRARGEIWRDGQGEAMGLLGSVLNDTPQKLAEIALVESTEQLQQQARQEQLLNQIANQIRTSLELDRILEITVREIQQFLGVDRCHFAWYVEEEEETYWDVIAEERNPDFPDFVGKHPVANFKDLSDLLKSQEILRLDDVTTLDDPELRETLNALGNQSMLVLPVSAESGDFGIIACIHHQVVRPWDDDEVEFLEAIVAQVAIAINQSYLLAQSQARNQELEELLLTLQRTQTQLIQSEKMSSLGQMVAGVAHEINNPVSFIHGNLVHAREYMEDLLGLCSLYEEHYPNPHPQIIDEIEAIDFEFLKGDLQKLFQSMNVGTNRIGEIVSSLRTFSRLDEAALKDIDIHEGIDSTLMLLKTRLRAQDWRSEIEVLREYGDLPRVECYAGQLNQVFMNLLSNAIDALESRYRNGLQLRDNPIHVQIHIKTVWEGDNISIHISDNGEGMDENTKANIFNPFFTTKPVGKGTGLGLAIAHQIITETHGGTITCTSTPGQGTAFAITLPLLVPG